MGTSKTVVCGLLLLAIAASGRADGGGEGRDFAERTPPPPRRPAAPLPAEASTTSHFEANLGQADSRLRFIARLRGYGAGFTDSGAVFLLPGKGGREAPRDLLRMEFTGARPGTALAAAGRLPGRSHYFLGKDPSRWVKGVEHLGSLHRTGLWPGVDLEWKGLPSGGLEYAFAVDPGADPGPIALSFDGAVSVEVDPSGDLLVSTAGGVLRHSRPVAWQEEGGRRRPVPAGFSAGVGGTVRLVLGAHDPRLPLRIDPSVTFSTWEGGSDWDWGGAIAAMGSGGFVVTGTTSSFNFPLLLPWQGEKNGSTNSGDVFLSRFSADGHTLLWSTYIGGYTMDESMGVAVDGSDAIYVAGRTTSDDYPVLHAYKSGGGATDGFLTKIQPDGDELIYSTRLGGNDTDYVKAIAVTEAGVPVVAGITGSSDFPKIANLQNYKGDYDAFVMRFKADGSAPDFSTHLGGSGEDAARGVAVTHDGAILVAGYTKSSNFPVAAAHQETLSGTQDGFVVRIEGTPPAAVYSTYLGGTGIDEARAVAVSVVLDEEGLEIEDAWVAGTSMSSTGFPLVAPLRSDFVGASEGFLSRLSPAGELLFSTFLGGAGADVASAVCTDPWDGVYVAGGTSSYDFPTSGAIQESKSGAGDAFVTILDSRGPWIHSSTYFGGNGEDAGLGVALASDGLVGFTGTTASADLPVSGAIRPTFGGGASDAFAAGFLEIPFPPRGCAVSLTGLRSVEVTWSDTCMGETSFSVERSSGGGAFSSVGSVPAGATVFKDQGLEPSTLYAYRVRAVNGEGASGPSDPDEILTPAIPTLAPAAPSDLVAAATGPRRVELDWSDNSDNEDFFLVARSADGVFFDTLATPGIGKTAYVDTTADPDLTYHYTVRAVNPVGSSLKSNVAVATLPSTLELVVGKSRLVDREGASRDTVKMTGSFGFGPEAESDEFNPMARLTALDVGGRGGTRVLLAPAGDEGWRSKKGKWTWKSPKWSTDRVKLTVVGATGAFTLSVKRMNFIDAPANPLRVALVLGTDSVTVEEQWTEGKQPGDLRHP